MSEEPTFAAMVARLISPGQRSAAARTVEAFGWLIALEGGAMLLAPHWVAAVLHLPDFSAAAAVYFRLVGLLVSGLGMLYVVCGRLDSRGFIFASLLDRPLVPVAMFCLWSWGLLPSVLAVLFSLQDFGGFLWTLWAWRKARA